MLQAMVNAALFVLSYTQWDNIQPYFWGGFEEDSDFLNMIVGMLLGIIEYYWCFMTISIVILGAVFLICAACQGTFGLSGN